MRNFDPSSLFVFFAILVFSGIVDFPFLIVMFFIFMFVRSASNKKKKQVTGNRRDQRRTQSRQYNQRRRSEADFRRQNAPKRRPAQPAPKPRPKNNPFKASGLNKYRDYEYEGAIEDFNKALQINSEDIAVHFNLACAYSLTEQVDLSYDHLSKAVKYGFADFEKIKNHDALAFLRIQDDFDDFVKTGYKRSGVQTAGAQTKESTIGNNDILEQLNKLGELKERGLLTDEEFILQKKRLLG